MSIFFHARQGTAGKRGLLSIAVLQAGSDTPLLSAMKALLLLPALVVLVLSSPPAMAAEPTTKKEPATVAFVKKLYKAHDSDQGPLSEHTMTALSKWFEPSLSAVLFKAVSYYEMAIDFDPFTPDHAIEQ